LRTLNFCMLLPGPEAQQVATYIGWRLHGTLGGIVAGSFFVIPSIFVLWLLSYLAVAHSDVPAITGLLYGIQPVVIAIVVEAVLRIGKRTINHRVLVGFAVLAFVALYFFSVPFPLIVLAAAVAGLILSRTSFAGDAFAGGGTALRRKKSLPSTGRPQTAGPRCCATSDSSVPSSCCGLSRWGRSTCGVGATTC
jgi:chromate transporter